MKLGTQVKHTPPVLQGTVKAARWEEVAAKLQVLVASDDGHERWFYADELEVVSVPQPEGEQA